MGTNRTFTSVMQLLLVFLMLLSIILIGQKSSFNGYKAGLILLAVATLSQIAFGNIPPAAHFSKSIRMYAIFMGVTALIFAISIALAPMLVNLGR